MKFLKSIYNHFFGPKLDELRGMHEPRSVESERFSRELKAKRLNKPVVEYYDENRKWTADDPPKLIQIDDSVMEEFLRDFLKTHGGNYYTGRIKEYTFTSGRVRYFALAEFVHYDIPSGGFIHTFQGHNPPTGRYDADSREMRLFGPEPLIKGANYEKNT